MQGRTHKNIPKGFVQHLRRLHGVTVPRETVFDMAFALFDRYSLSHWDSMLLAACIDAGVERLYTEDMGAPQQIESIELVNPFAS